jgi:hypothetical protein
MHYTNIKRLLSAQRAGDPGTKKLLENFDRKIAGNHKAN